MNRNQESALFFRENPASGDSSSEPSKPSFMSRVREACALMGIRQKDLAASLELKPSQMNLYFQGKVEMRADRLLAVLNILGIDVERQLNEKIRELGGDPTKVTNSESRVLATLSRLNDSHKSSLLRIINTLGAQ